MGELLTPNKAVKKADSLKLWCWHRQRTGQIGSTSQCYMISLSARITLQDRIEKILFKTNGTRQIACWIGKASHVLQHVNIYFRTMHFTKLCLTWISQTR